MTGIVTPSKLGFMATVTVITIVTGSVVYCVRLPVWDLANERYQNFVIDSNLATNILEVPR